MCNSRTGKTNPWQKKVSIMVDFGVMGMGINWKGKGETYG